MKVLWFTNVPFPDAGPEFGGSVTGSGGWLWGLADALRQHTQISLGVVTACRDGKDLQVEKNGICHYRVAVPGKRFNRVTQIEPDQDFISRCQKVATAFSPDLLHIHGTEWTYGLLTAKRHLGQPAIVSIQGVLRGLLPNMLGNMKVHELIRCHGVMNLLFRNGIIFNAIHMRKRCSTEASILNGNQYFIGRTLWDRAQLRMVNPSATYLHCDEVLRPVFYQDLPVVIKQKRPVILATWGASPLRGTHVLLRALALVLREIPDVELRLPRGQFRRSRFFRDYCTHLDDLINQLGISAAVTLLPGLTADEYANEMHKAHAFVQASLVENSSNTLCEAMLLGTPCVVSYAGGMPSLVKDEENALCFPPGEHAVLAEQLLRLLRDPALSQRLSKNARNIAQKRHDPKTIANRTVEIYEKLVMKATKP
jgi:glycosyltransferase involved in cell wall biosynthesis